MWTRQELKERAKENFRASYWKSVLAGIVLLAIGGIARDFDVKLKAEQAGLDAQSWLSGGAWGWLLWFLIVAGMSVTAVVILIILLNIFVLDPIMIGCRKYYLETGYGKPDLGHLGFSFQTNYFNIVKVEFLTRLEIFLWTLLLIIPGVIKGYSFKMVPYLLAENPDITVQEAKQRSAEMMDGQKWDAFVLDLSFLLWHILSGITMNVAGIFWVNPYVALTEVELYKVLAGNSQGQEQTAEW